MKTKLFTKTIAIASILTLLTTGTVNAQNIGLRLGYGAELSYQHLLGESNRLEVNLGLTDYEGGFNLAGTYQWVKPLEGNFNWYLGAGAGIGVWNDVFGLAAVGQLGIEYNFSGPLQMSIDWRPGLKIVPEFGFWATSIGFSIRYRIGN